MNANSLHAVHCSSVYAVAVMCVISVAAVVWAHKSSWRKSIACGRQFPLFRPSLLFESFLLLLSVAFAFAGIASHVFAGNIEVALWVVTVLVDVISTYGHHICRFELDR